MYFVPRYSKSGGRYRMKYFEVLTMVTVGDGVVPWDTDSLDKSTNSNYSYGEIQFI